MKPQANTKSDNYDELEYNEIYNAPSMAYSYGTNIIDPMISTA